jgi:hypothetical protein
MGLSEKALTALFFYHFVYLHLIYAIQVRSWTLAGINIMKKLGKKPEIGYSINSQCSLEYW